MWQDVLQSVNILFSFSTLLFLFFVPLGNAILNGKLLHVCILCILIYVKRLKLELDIPGGFISTFIPLYFQGKVPCSAKISVCLYALTVFLETGMRLSFGYPSGAPHKHNGKNLGV